MHAKPKKGRKAPAANSKKRLPVGKIIIGFGLAVVLVVFATREAKPPAKDNTFRVNIPARLSLDGLYFKSEPFPASTKEQLLEASNFILEFRENPHLSHSEDQEIYRLLDDYRTGRRTFTVNRSTEPTDKNGGSAAMYYECFEDAFYLGNTALSTQMFAIAFYHELAHVVHCERDMKKYKVSDREKMRGWGLGPMICTTEAVGWAASTRFFEALAESRRFDSRVSQDDGGIVQGTYEAWRSLREGRFCEWYATYRSGRETGYKKLFR